MTKKEGLDLGKRGDEMSEAVKRLWHLSKDDFLHEVAEKERMEKAKARTAMNFAEERGEERGVKKTALNMLKLGSDESFISQVTGLSKEEIQALSNTLKEGEP